MQGKCDFFCRCTSHKNPDKTSKKLQPLNDDIISTPWYWNYSCVLVFLCYCFNNNFIDLSHLQVARIIFFQNFRSEFVGEFRSKQNKSNNGFPCIQQFSCSTFFFHLSSHGVSIVEIFRIK